MYGSRDTHHVSPITCCECGNLVPRRHRQACLFPHPAPPRYDAWRCPPRTVWPRSRAIVCITRDMLGVSLVAESNTPATTTASATDRCVDDVFHHPNRNSDCNSYNNNDDVTTSRVSTATSDCIYGTDSKAAVLLRSLLRLPLTALCVSWTASRRLNRLRQVVLHPLLLRYPRRRCERLCVVGVVP